MAKDCLKYQTINKNHVNLIKYTLLDIGDLISLIKERFIENFVQKNSNLNEIVNININEPEVKELHIDAKISEVDRSHFSDIFKIHYGQARSKNVPKINDMKLSYRVSNMSLYVVQMQVFEDQLVVLKQIFEFFGYHHIHGIQHIHIIRLN
ncbi:hypothetical protein HZH68_000978 [Vespula germanica]|uniref:Uncharacterized protein n=1 Tax=Vespula germanica TaxID=30212 RepID=A0A834NUR4_VESGE|nr:hypothetical protein HZH68_000978 [Vespula germanica]